MPTLGIRPVPQLLEENENDFKCKQSWDKRTVMRLINYHVLRSIADRLLLQALVLEKAVTLRLPLSTQIATQTRATEFYL